ncbi:response regulator [Deltaproteobacteria bacterium TL4]
MEKIDNDPLNKKLLPRFSNLKIRQKLLLIYIIFATNLVGLASVGWFGMNTLSTIRAYVGGEGLWAKAQKEAIYYLQSYSFSHNINHYLKFQTLLKIPLGNSKARLELNQVNPNMELAIQGFMEGMNVPEEAKDMAHFFVRFRHFDYIAQTIKTWTEADGYILELQRLGADLYQLHQQLPHSDWDLIPEQKRIFEKINEVNDKLSELENRFSFVLGEASRWAKNLLLYAFLGGTLLSGLFGIFISTLISKNVLHNLSIAVQIAKRVSKGDLSAQLLTASKDETGELLNTLQKMIDRLKEMTEIAIAVTDRNYDLKVSVNGEEDLLGQSLNTMLTNLLVLSTENSLQRWRDQGRSNLYDAMRGEQSINNLAQSIISCLVPYVDAQFGALYIKDQGSFHLMGSYAYASPQQFEQTFKPGQGLVGQAAFEKKTLFYDNIPHDYVQIRSGIGQTSPKNILIIPLLYAGQTIAVLEMASSYSFTETQMSFLESLRENVSIALNSAQARSRLEELLEQTQKQAETLKIQQSKLQLSNKEYEIQTQALTESKHELSKQQEQLKTINEELEAKTYALEAHQMEIERKNKELKRTGQELEEKAHDLELSSQYKSEFLANMSHELRTPLNSLLILSEILANNKDGNLSPKQVEFANTIHNSGSDLLRLINQVLDLSKVEAGKIEMVIEEVSLLELMNSIKQRFQRLIEKKGLAFHIELDTGLPSHISTDPFRVEQILNNFLSNAHKFTEQGSITFRVTKVSRYPSLILNKISEQTLVFAVEDTGIGIPKNKQELVFEAFSQVDGSISRKYGGTGLGLSISKTFAELLGGSVSIQSQEGIGSTFFLLLPFKAPESISTPLVQQAKANEYLIESPSSHASIHDDRDEISPNDKTILIIEDDPSFSEIVRDIAHQYGFKGIIAVDGQMGVKLALKHQPTAIILDVMLPKMDGWQVIEALKRTPETRRIPIHFISVVDEKTKAMQSGAVGFFTKPISQRSLETVFIRLKNAVTTSYKRVLVIENEELLTPQLRSLMRNRDVITSVSGNNEILVKHLKDSRYDCIVIRTSSLEGSLAALMVHFNQQESSNNPLLIIYVDHELSKEDEEALVTRNVEGLLIKETHSINQLFDEILTFVKRLSQSLDLTQKHQLSDNVALIAQGLEGKTILLVDDDARSSFALSQMLEGHGIKYKLVFDGEEALSALNAGPYPDLIFMDIMMPGMDGYEIIKAIRERNALKKTPIIALTANAMKGDREKCLDYGANDYLSKPIVSDLQFLSMIKKWVESA